MTFCASAELLEVQIITISGTMSHEHNNESNVNSKGKHADKLGLQFEELIVGLTIDGVLNVASILDIRKTRYSDKTKFYNFYNFLL